MAGQNFSAVWAYNPEFQENIERWQQQGLTIVNIAPYSPELNIIEILWRKIKYEWMPFSAYESFQNLKESLFDILRAVKISVPNHPKIL